PDRGRAVLDDDHIADLHVVYDFEINPVIGMRLGRRDGIGSAQPDRGPVIERDGSRILCHSPDWHQQQRRKNNQHFADHLCFSLSDFRRPSNDCRPALHPHSLTRKRKRKWLKKTWNFDETCSGMSRPGDPVVIPSQQPDETRLGCPAMQREPECSGLQIAPLRALARRLPAPTWRSQKKDAAEAASLRSELNLSLSHRKRPNRVEQQPISTILRDTRAGELLVLVQRPERDPVLPGSKASAGL